MLHISRQSCLSQYMHSYTGPLFTIFQVILSMLLLVPIRLHTFHQVSLWNFAVSGNSVLCYAAYVQPVPFSRYRFECTIIFLCTLSSHGTHPVILCCYPPTQPSNMKYTWSHTIYVFDMPHLSMKFVDEYAILLCTLFCATS